MGGGEAEEGKKKRKRRKRRGRRRREIEPRSGLIPLDDLVPPVNVVAFFEENKRAIVGDLVDQGAD